jgi:hypothetical protein
MAPESLSSMARPGFALVPAAGDVRLLFAGGPGMLPSAVRQTWIKDVRALRGIEADLPSWLNEIDRDPKLGVALWDGAALSELNFRALVRATQGRRITGTGAEFDVLRRSKSDVERGLIARAAEISVEVFQAFDEAISAGSDIRSAGLAAERAGYASGAQDVRVLGSHRPGGAPLLLESARDLRPASANVYVAVRHAGYWADFHGEAGETTALTRDAQSVLHSALQHVKPGLLLSDLKRLAGDSADVRVDLSGIGAKQHEAPDVDEGVRLEKGDICSLCVEARAAERRGFASALFCVEQERVAILSQSAPSSRKAFA